MTIVWALLVLAVTLAALPLRVAGDEAPAEDAAGGGEEPGPDRGDDAAPAGEAGGGEALSTLESIVDRTLAEASAGGTPRPGGPAPEKPAAPPAAEKLAPPPGEGAAGPRLPEGLSPRQVLEQLGCALPAVAGLAPEQAAAVEQQVAEALTRWYTERYAPVAEEVRGLAEQHQAWYQQLTQFTQGGPYRLAEYLAGNPELYERVRQAVQGGGTTAPDHGKTVDPASLDDDSRAIYETARTALAQNEELRGALVDMQQRYEQLESSVRDSQARLNRHQAERDLETSRPHLAQAMDGLAKDLGFDPRSRPEYRELIADAMLRLEGMRGQAAAEGRRLGAIDVGDLLRRSARAVGLYEARQRRIEQARTAKALPRERSASRGEPVSLEDIVDGAIAAAG